MSSDSESEKGSDAVDTSLDEAHETTEHKTPTGTPLARKRKELPLVHHRQTTVEHREYAQELSEIKEKLRREHSEELRRLNEQHQSELHQLKEQLRNLAEKKAHESETGTRLTENRLKEREEELETLRQFLSSHNESSDEEVVHALDTIHNMGAALVERTMDWISHPIHHSDVDTKKESNRTAMAEVLGHELLEALEMPMTTSLPESGLLQFALEASLVDVISGILRPFSVSLLALDVKQGRPSEEVISRLLEEIGRNETQTVQSRWRSLTHHYISRVVVQADRDELTKLFVQDAHSKWSFVTAVALKGGLLDWKRYDELFSRDMRAIVSRVFALSTIIREQVASKNIHLISPQHHSRFDTGIMSISPAIGGDEAYTTADSWVACTTRLGLSYTTDARDVKKSRHQILKKPTVVTQTAIQDLLHSDVK